MYNTTIRQGSPLNRKVDTSQEKAQDLPRSDSRARSRVRGRSGIGAQGETQSVCAEAQARRQSVYAEAQARRSVSYLCTQVGRLLEGEDPEAFPSIANKSPLKSAIHRATGEVLAKDHAAALVYLLRSIATIDYPNIPSVQEIVDYINDEINHEIATSKEFSQSVGEKMYDLTHSKTGKPRPVDKMRDRNKEQIRKLIMDELTQAPKLLSKIYVYISNKIDISPEFTQKIFQSIVKVMLLQYPEAAQAMENVKREVIRQSVAVSQGHTG